MFFVQNYITHSGSVYFCSVLHCRDKYVFELWCRSLQCLRQMLNCVASRLCNSPIWKITCSEHCTRLEYLVRSYCLLEFKMSVSVNRHIGVMGVLVHLQIHIMLKFTHMCMLCCVWLFLVVSTSAIDCLERLVSEMTYYVSSGTLNPTRSL